MPISTAHGAFSTTSSRSTLFSTVCFHFKNINQFENGTQTTSRWAELSATSDEDVGYSTFSVNRESLSNGITVQA